MNENSNISCDGCGKRVDMYYCTRTFVNHRWYYFCHTCEKNGKAGIIARRLFEDERNKSGAE